MAILIKIYLMYNLFLLEATLTMPTFCVHENLELPDGIHANDIQRENGTKFETVKIYRISLAILEFNFNFFWKQRDFVPLKALAVSARHCN